MPRPRIISADRRESKRVELSDGDWVKLKRKLDYGEASELYDATYRSGVGGPARGTTREVRMSEFNITRIALYVLDWSFRDDKDQPIPITADSIRRLDTDTADELHAAINALEAENDQLEKEGKEQAGKAGSSTSSASSQPAPAGSSKSASAG